jgi:DGQHR domain-containing protein
LEVSVDDQLKAAFTDEERELAGSLGEREDIELAQKVSDLFAELPDPLLSADDVKQLLGVSASETELTELMHGLCDEGLLEFSTNTQRPLDPEDLQLFRLAARPIERLRLLALEEQTGEESPRYQFTCDGRLIRSLAVVDRLDAVAETGVQRDEIKSHVREIARGIEAGIQIPNAILLAFLQENTVIREPGSEPEEVPGSFIIIRVLDEYSEIARPDDPTGPPAQRVRLVEIDIPYRRACFDEEKSVLLVDGQQRTAALSLVPVDKVPAYGLSVNSVVADENASRDVFRVANNTVKIATEFSRALLAALPEAPGYLKEERLRAQATRILAIVDTDSPFFDITRHPGTPSSGKPIVYNTLFNAVTAFDRTALPFDDDPQELADTVTRAFAIVKNVWPEAWGLPTGQSKLMHGAGLRAMANHLARKLDARYEVLGTLGDAQWEEIRESIERLRAEVVWTPDAAGEGTNVARHNWTTHIAEKQNTNQDITALTDFLRDADDRARRNAEA